MRTRDVMSSPVVTVAPDAHLKDVAATLVEHGINAVPVVEEGDRLVGIVTEADLLTLEAALTPGARPGSLAAGKGPPHTAGEVMSRSVYTLTEDTDATEAARLMLRHRLKSVPVVAGDRVVALVARRDLLRRPGPHAWPRRSCPCSFNLGCGQLSALSHPAGAPRSGKPSIPRAVRRDETVRSRPLPWNPVEASRRQSRVVRQLR